MAQKPFFLNHEGSSSLFWDITLLRPSVDSQVIHVCLCVHSNLFVFLYLPLCVLKSHTLTLILPILMQHLWARVVFLPLYHSEKSVSCYLTISTYLIKSPIGKQSPVAVTTLFPLWMLSSPPLGPDSPRFGCHLCLCMDLSLIL